MTDPSREHERPEAEPLADARRNLAAAKSALAAACHLQPSLTSRLSVLHAQLADVLTELDRV